MSPQRLPELSPTPTSASSTEARALGRSGRARNFSLAEPRMEDPPGRCPKVSSAKNLRKIGTYGVVPGHGVNHKAARPTARVLNASVPH